MKHVSQLDKQRMLEALRKFKKCKTDAGGKRVLGNAVGRPKAILGRSASNEHRIG